MDSYIIHLKKKTLERIQWKALVFLKHFYVINAAQGSNPPKLIFIALVSEQRQRGRRKEACRKKGKLSTKNVEKC